VSGPVLPVGPFAKLSRPAKWGVLLLLSALFSALFTWVRLPAALLLGAMVAGIVIENGGAQIRIPALLSSVAQAVIGCMVARSLTPGILHSFLGQWPLILGTSLLTIVVSCGLGWLISKFRILPETTAIWGLLPGAASVMMIMADAYGADSRLVAFMQYLRVAMVALIASLVARFWVHPTAAAAASAAVAPVGWFAPVHGLPFAETMAVIAAGVLLGRWSRLPGGIILVTMFIGITLQAGGFVMLELPRWLLALCYSFLGWSVGLRFTRGVLAYAARALPQTLLSILVLLLFCGSLAFLLVEFLHVDPLTAYLATSPGGIDSIVIIAASTKVNLGFIMAQQTARFLLVLLIGPVLSRYVADRV
jgi:membrane AbrB-like protein